jgi:hypothetical protein
MKSALKTVVQWSCVSAVLLAASGPSIAQRRGEPILPRNQTGGVGQSVPNGVYQVVSVDSYNRAVQMQPSNGPPFTVYVDDGVYDLSKLKPGAMVQVNFLVPDGLSNKLKAANIWPAQ